MNCPTCARPLAAGTRQCVYCGRGTGVRVNSNVIDRSAPRPAPARKRGWGGWILTILVLLAVGAVVALPQVREQLKPLWESLRKLF